MNNVYMYIDASEVTELLNDMASKLTVGNFDRLMRRSLNEVGKRSKKPIKEAVLAEYEAPSHWVHQGIKSAKISGGGPMIYCTIPLESERGNIGSVFGAAGGNRGWSHRKYKMRARIVRSGVSVLPSTMDHQGGQPPFRNLAFSGLTFTRAGKSRLPIERVSGLALPQMPLNRSRAETEEKIITLTQDRVLHNFGFMFG